MKIKDILNEAGILDRVTQGVKGAVSNLQKSQRERQSISTGGTNLQYDLSNWNNYFRKQQSIYPNEIKNNDFVKQLLLNWAQQNYPRADRNLFNRISTLNALNQQSVQAYIADLFNSEISNFRISKPTTQQAIPSPVSQPTASPEDNFLNNYKIVQHNPLVYQFANKPNKLYHLNDRGQWAAYPGQKEVDQTTSALLTQAAERDGV